MVCSRTFSMEVRYERTPTTRSRRSVRAPQSTLVVWSRRRWHHLPHGSRPPRPLPISLGLPSRYGWRPLALQSFAPSRRHLRRRPFAHRRVLPYLPMHAITIHSLSPQPICRWLLLSSHRCLMHRAQRRLAKRTDRTGRPIGTARSVTQSRRQNQPLR